MSANVSTTWVGTVDLQGAGTVTVNSGVTMTMGTSSAMVLGSTDDVVVNGTISHTTSNITGIQITARNITVNSGALINANEKGCLGGATGGADGFGPNASTGVCAITTTSYGKGYGGGAAHAGVGGTGGYDSASNPKPQTTVSGISVTTAPTFLGSGGGGGSNADELGGGGGGRIYLRATGTLTVNGTVSANGGNGTASGNIPGGGGSGGSVYVVAGTLAGSGSITAGGGNGGSTGGVNGGGGGGGGRVAVYYDTLSTFALASITATAGSKGSGSIGANGTKGSTWILDRTTDDGAGNVRVTSGLDFSASGDFTRTSMTIDTGARLGCETQSTLNISISSVLSLSSVDFSCSNSIDNIFLTTTGHLSTTSTTFTFVSTTNFRLTAPTWTNVTTTFTVGGGDASSTINITGGSLTLQDFNYVGSAVASSTYTNGGVVTFQDNTALTMTSSTIIAGVVSSTLLSLSLDANSSLDARGMGCKGGFAANTNGYGPHTTTGICTLATSGYGQAYGGGAAHAGTGGGGGYSGLAQTTTYGSSTLPMLFGAGGGGGGTDGVEAGGNGGGRISLLVTGTMTVNGTITANGANGSGTNNIGGGGGSGGSIYARVGTLAGTGVIRANGGNGGVIAPAANGGGGGGGGRVALLYSALTFSGTSSTTKGTKATGSTGVDGTDGSIYTLLLNQSPDVPSSLGPTALVNGSTTGTNNPIFSFTLSDPDVDTVKYRIQIDDSSNFGSPVVDYTSALAAEGARTFQVGQAAGSGSYTVGSAGQTLSDTSYYWRVKTIDAAAAESSYSTANSGAVAFIVDTASRLLSFQLSSGSGAESVTATSIRILLNTTHFEHVTVNYAVIGASTTAEGSGVDYTLSSGTATITAGQTSTTISLTVVNDDIDEPDETIGIQLSSPTYAVIGSNTTTLYTVTDNDTAGVTVTEPGGSTTSTEGGATDTFTVVLTSQPTSTVQIAFTTSTYGLTLSTSTLYFTSSNWSSAQTVTVTATNDDIYEGTHTTSVQPTISAAGLFAYPSVSIASVSATITDNDTAGITVSSVTGSAVEGGASATYTLVLTSQPTSTVTVALTADTGETSLSASNFSFTSANWNTPQTVTVSALNDSIDEASYATSVTHLITSSGILGYTSALSIASASVNVTDNDTAGVTVSPTTRALSEGGASSTYTIVLTSQPTSTVQVILTVPSDLTVSTSTLTFTGSNWNTPQTVTVNATQDSLQEGTHIATTTHAVNLPSGFAFGYATLSSLSAFVATIADDEVASMAIAPTTLRIREAETGSYAVVLGTSPTTTVQMLLVPSDGFTLSTSTLTFTTSNWNTPQTVTASVPSDTTVLGDRLGTITQTVSTTALGYSALTLSPITVTLVEIQARGGGAAGSGAGGTSGTGGGGSVQTIANLVPQASPIPPAPIVSSDPIIVVLPLPSAPSPSLPLLDPSAPSAGPIKIITILNPSDVRSLVEATQSSRDFAREAMSLRLVREDSREFRVPLPDTQSLVLSNFIAYGISERTRTLGTGERRALVRDAIETMRTTTLNPADLERMTRGIIPLQRNIAQERSQLPRVRQTFRTIYGHDPNFKDPSENLAWNTLMYRIRFPRDLRAEREGIQDFRRTFGRVPNTPFQWAAVRVMGYIVH